MITVAILTISDSAAAGAKQDLSGPALEERCKQWNWRVVAKRVVADDENAIANVLRQWADDGTASLILTTGGTGVALRDVTPEATRRVIDHEIAGIAELMRSEGRKQTKFSVLSRAIAGTRKESLIVNLPGSPRGAVYSLETIEHLAPHVIGLLQGHTMHPADEKLRTVSETHQVADTSQDV